MYHEKKKYVFGIKKCGECDCSICKPPRLPVDLFKDLYHSPDPVLANELHHKSFTDMLHRVLSDTGLLAGANLDILSWNPNAQTAGGTHYVFRCVYDPELCMGRRNLASNARGLIMCSECLPPRVIYAPKTLSLCPFSCYQGALFIISSLKDWM